MKNTDIRKSIAEINTTEDFECCPFCEGTEISMSYGVSAMDKTISDTFAECEECSASGPVVNADTYLDSGKFVCADSFVRTAFTLWQTRGTT